MMMAVSKASTGPADLTGFIDAETKGRELNFVILASLRALRG